MDLKFAILVVCCISTVIVFFVSKKTHPLPSRIILASLIAGFGFFIFFVAAKMENKRATKIEGKNLVEILNHQKIEKGMTWRERTERSYIEPSIAFTISNLNLREGPGINYEIITVIPEDERVVWRRMFSPRHPTYKREGEWILVVFNGKLGWVNGTYLRPALLEERSLVYFPNIRKLVQSLFPEATIKGKIFGVLLATPIKLLTDLLFLVLFGFRDKIFIGKMDFDRDIVSLLGPTIYFLVKTNYFTNVPPEEFMLLVLFIFALSVLASLPAIFLKNILKKKFLPEL